MEIALFLVLAFVAFIYFSAGLQHTPLHRTFSVLLVATLLHLVFDGATIYTVNHLDTVPRALNDSLHRLFIGTMVLVVYLFFRYISILVQEETGKPRRSSGPCFCLSTTPSPLREIIPTASTSACAMSAWLSILFSAWGC